MGPVQKLVRFLTAAVFLSFTMPAYAIDKPTGDILLTVGGNIEKTNTNDGTAAFDQDMLSALPSVTIKTTTPWTDGAVTFEGALLRDILKSVGGSGETLKATAHNDYSVNIPKEDFLKFDVIVAYKRDGEIMTLRSKGPLWIIYPWDSHEELMTELYHSRSIWQLKSLDIR